jgi:hypothetical protein
MASKGRYTVVERLVDSSVGEGLKTADCLSVGRIYRRDAHESFSASLRVPKILFGEANLRLLGIAEIHILPLYFINPEKLSRAQGATDRANQRPGRKPVYQAGRPDEVRLDAARRVVALEAQLFDASNVVSAHIADPGAD